MELKFKSTGSTNEFATWLKGFKDILPSLLIEVDLETNEFIAKSFPPEKTIVKFSKISFEDAGFELTSITNGDDVIDWRTHDTDTDGRVKIGIYESLGKLIDVISMFATTDHEFIINFDICNNVMYMGAKKAEKEYMATSITLKSMSLTMIIMCASLSDFFQKCDDETFLTRVCNIGSPSTYEVSTDTLANLNKISSVYNDPKNRSIIKFYSKQTEDDQWALYAFDDTSKTYDYLLGYQVDGIFEKTATSVFKDIFLSASKGLTSENLKITLDTAGASRILIDSEDAKVVVAAAKK